MGPTGPVKDPVRVAQEVHMSVVETSPVEHVRQVMEARLSWSHWPLI